MDANTVPHSKIVVDLIHYYYTPLLVYLGIIGNCVSVYVIYKTKLRKLSSSYYLAALATSDTIFLINIFMVWLTMNEINVFNRSILCETMIYFSSVSSCLSVWLVMAFTAERFVAVLYPLKSKVLCTVSRAKIIIAALVASTLIIYYPYVLAAEVKTKDNSTICDVNTDWENWLQYYNIFDTILTCLVPTVFITVLNTCISRNIWKFFNVRRRMTNAQLDTNDSLSRVKSKASKSSHNTTKMLLIISTVFMVLNLPSYIIRIVVFLITSGIIYVKDPVTVVVIQQYCQLLFNTNFGITFVLYCISGQNFRRAVASACCCGKNQREISAVPENGTQSTTASSSSFMRKRKI